MSSRHGFVKIYIVLLVAVLIFEGLWFYLHRPNNSVKTSPAQKSENLKLTLGIITAKTQRLINQTEEILFELSRSRAIGARDVKACQNEMRHYLKMHDEYPDFVAADLNGNVFCSGYPLKGPVNISDRSYFKKVTEEGKFAAGEYQVGRVTGKTIIVFGYPLLGPEGKINGVIAVGLDLNWLATSWAQSLDLPAGYVFSLLDRNGTVLVYYPAAMNMIDSKGTEAVQNILRAHEEQKTDGTFEASGLDGVKRTYVFTTIASGLPQGAGNLNFYVLVGT